jgi:hypothetical protein
MDDRAYYPNCPTCGHNLHAYVGRMCTAFVAYPPGDERGLAGWCGHDCTSEPAIRAWRDGVTITRAVQTCSAAPSQWDAWDADGNYYYLRYRWGHGTVERCTSPDWYKYDDGQGDLIATFDYGDPLDGSIELEEFAALAGLRLELDRA